MVKAGAPAALAVDPVHVAAVVPALAKTRLNKNKKDRVFGLFCWMQFIEILIAHADKKVLPRKIQKDPRSGSKAQSGRQCSGG
jgi:hypothetical protein